FSQITFLDPSFGDGGIVNTFLPGVGINTDFGAVALQDDGKIIASGVTAIVYFGRFTIVRYNSDGTLDSTFADNGIELTDVPNVNIVSNGLTIQPDGKIIQAGTYSEEEGCYFFLARYNTNGSIDTTFGLEGMLFIYTQGNATSSPLILQPDGK